MERIAAMMSLFDLNGKKAIAVGCAGDLGLGMVEGLLDAGADVVIIDIAKNLDQLVSAFAKTSDGAVFGVKADIADRDDIRRSFSEALDLLGGNLDILVNAAGIQRRYPSEVFPENEWDEVLAINLTAPFLYCQLAARVMIPQGKGKIINVCSLQSYIGGVTIPAYAASKGGIGQLTKTLANDWAKSGLNVNGIAPGYMDTKLNTALMADPVRSSEILGRIPQGRWGTGADMKGITVFLASEASDYVNGVIIPVDGGFLGR